MGTLTGSEILARALKAQGMDTLFFLMGGPMLETESELVRIGTKMIDTHHEQAAAMMAHAWTRLTRKPGVCMASSGPGDRKSTRLNSSHSSPSRMPSSA